MQFSRPAPGLLTDSWVGTWKVFDDNFGYSQAQVISWVASALNDPRGWGRAGVSFSGGPGTLGVPDDSKVRFVVVKTIAFGGGDAIGLCTHYDDGSALIQLEAAWFGNMDLVNHEAGHGFFYGEHSPEGTDSIMEPMDDPGPGEEWPSATDIAQLRAWLGDPPRPDPDPDPLPEPAEPQTYFFPGDLPHYITKWPVSAGAKARVTATVVDPAPALIRPVWAPTHEEMLAKDYKHFCRGIGTERMGFDSTEWHQAGGTGDIYVGLVIDAEAGVSLDELVIAHAEVHIVGAGGGSSRSIAN